MCIFFCYQILWSKQKKVLTLFAAPQQQNRDALFQSAAEPAIESAVMPQVSLLNCLLIHITAPKMDVTEKTGTTVAFTMPSIIIPVTRNEIALSPAAIAAGHLSFVLTSVMAAEAQHILQERALSTASTRTECSIADASGQVRSNQRSAKIASSPSNAGDHWNIRHPHAICLIPNASGGTSFAHEALLAFHAVAFAYTYECSRHAQLQCLGTFPLYARVKIWKLLFVITDL